jgi:chromosome segregation ATPase
MNDLRILEQQQRESKRMLESMKLTKVHKLEQKKGIDVNLSNLKYQVGEMRAELQRANKELSKHHRQVLDARSRSEKSRKDSTRFDAKMKRAIGVARVLATYQNKVEAAIIGLNEQNAKLNFKKAQMLRKLNAARVRRDDAKHRYDLLAKAIQTNQHKERAIKEELSRIRSETTGNEHDLSSAQQIESQTKLRVQTIEHEVELEQTRHVDAVADLESKHDEMTASKTKELASVEAMKADIAAKKEELRKMWEKSNQIRKAEGHEVLPEPKWGVDQAPSLDVARISVRVNAQEEELRASKSEKETLQLSIVELEERSTAQKEEAVAKRDETSELLKGVEKEREEAARLSQEINEIVENADVECKEVEKLQATMNDLSAAQAKNSGDMKLLLEKNEGDISAMEAKIESIDKEIVVLEESDMQRRDEDAAAMAKIDKDIADAQKASDVVQGVYERAQKEVAAYNALPDDTLALQMRQLDEAEQDIIDDANREREEIFEGKFH